MAQDPPRDRRTNAANSGGRGHRSHGGDAPVLPDLLDQIFRIGGDGRRFRVLAVVDDFTRECLTRIADTSLPGRRVLREPNAVIARRGCPGSIVSDDGTAFTLMAILCWCQNAGVRWHDIAAGKFMQHGFIESFNGRFRDALLPRCCFPTSPALEPRSPAGRRTRPHSAIGTIPRVEFAMKIRQEKQAAQRQTSKTL